MRYLYLALVVVSVAMLAGCTHLVGFWEGMTGTGGDPESASGAAGSTVGFILGTIFPWFTAAAGVAGGITQGIKKKKAGKVAISLVKGIKRSIDEKADISRITEILADEQNKAGVREEVRVIKHEVENGG